MKKRFFRICLKCEEEFQPKGKFQFICYDCKKRISADRINNIKINNYLKAVENMQ